MTKNPSNPTIQNDGKKAGIFIPAFLIFAVIIAFPRPAHADISSIFTSIFKGTNVSAQVSEVYDTASSSAEPISSSDSLLHSAVNIDPNPIKTEPDFLLVSNGALMAESGQFGTIADLDDDPRSTQISTYIVRQGDTLEEIADMFDVNVNTILWANSLSRTSILHDGQTLVILPISGVRHIISKGDTLQSIVKKYNVELKEVLSYNDITEASVLAVGETLMIPDAELEAPSEKVTTIKTTTKVGTKYAKLPVYDGYYARPVKNARRTQGIHGHNGVDPAASVGTPIYAAARGTVIISTTGGYNGGYGNYVVIAHPNGTQTLYAHTSANLVAVGERVEQGQMIAKVGNTGKSTGAHLHVEVRGARNPF